MNAAHKLQTLFDMIDRSVALEKGKNEGPFSFLKEDMMTRFITTTPNRRACVEALKTYLAKDILKINCGKDYVTYKNILENLEGTAKKKYQVDTWRLEACFDWEKNCDAIEKELNTSMVQLERTGNGWHQDYEIPWLLFGWIKEDVEAHLLKFWSLCNVSKGVDVNKKKQDEYMSALYGVALQEIFYKDKFSKKSERLWNTIEEGKKNLEALSKELMNEKLMLDTLTEEENRINFIQKIQSVSERLSEMDAKLKKDSVYLALDTEQNINLAVEFQLIMLFDSLNILGVTGEYLDKWLGKLRDGDLFCFYDKNPNRRKAYCKVDSYVEEMFLSYWKSVPESDKNDFPWALNTYFQQLEISHRTPEKVNHELMKRAKAIIIQAWITRQREKSKNPTLDSEFDKVMC